MRWDKMRWDKMRWDEMRRYEKVSLWYVMRWYGVIWYGTVWYGMWLGSNLILVMIPIIFIQLFFFHFPFAFLYFIRFWGRLCWIVEYCLFDWNSNFFHIFLFVVFESKYFICLKYKLLWWALYHSTTAKKTACTIFATNLCGYLMKRLQGKHLSSHSS